MYCATASLGTGRAEAAGAALGAVEVLDLANGRHGNALEDELGDAIALVDCTSADGPTLELTFEVLVIVVEEDDLDLATVVTVDDAGARVDAVLRREA